MWLYVAQIGPRYAELIFLLEAGLSGARAEAGWSQGRGKRGRVQAGCRKRRWQGGGMLEAGWRQGRGKLKERGNRGREGGEGERQ